MKIIKFYFVIVN